MEEEEMNLILSADKQAEEEAEAEDEVDGFDPTEDELVLHFLRPQLRGFPPRVAGAVLEADPCAAAPWELLERYGLRDRGHFFAARARTRTRRPAAAARRHAVGSAGAWLHSSSLCGRSVTELGVVVAWSRARFCFFARTGGGAQLRDAWWVMEEYEITDPRCYRRDDDGEEDDYWVLCRVRRISKPAAGLQQVIAR
ncbi:hypothetical protein BS78_K140500 [Paspalum vaginatum]|uniref:NAC domain-containing protein n=1 Tax=Paspalum vaginatum TaxID=158149 RepID=A0A9W7XC32_9POAL|nr:hypothetical protein BS78_K140500 [Paspalum vaginatum]